MDNCEKFENGMAVAIQEGHFYILAGEEKLEITEELYEYVRKNPDTAFDVVIGVKRKFGFNTAMDRYSPSEY